MLLPLRSDKGQQPAAAGLGIVGQQLYAVDTRHGLTGEQLVFRRVATAFLGNDLQLSPQNLDEKVAIAACRF
jgi:hypothetical protein